MASLAEMWDQAGADGQRRALLIAADAMMLCARGLGADDEQIKLAALALRSPEVAILTDEEAAIIIAHLDVGAA